MLTKEKVFKVSTIITGKESSIQANMVLNLLISSMVSIILWMVLSNNIFTTTANDFSILLLLVISLISGMLAMVSVLLLIIGTFTVRDSYHMTLFNMTLIGVLIITSAMSNDTYKALGKIIMRE